MVLSNGTVDQPANDNDAGVALRHTQLYANVLPAIFGKANGMGDIEALSNSAPLEIGNRLWCDTGVSGVGRPQRHPGSRRGWVPTVSTCA